MHFLHFNSYKCIYPHIISSVNIISYIFTVNIRQLYLTIINCYFFVSLFNFIYKLIKAPNPDK